MVTHPTDRRPQRSLADFLPKRPKRFERTPPAIFPAILGLLGLGTALRRAVDNLGLSQEPVNLLLGAMVGLWILATVAILGKIARRPATVFEDLRVLPGRIGFAAAPLSGMMVCAVLVPFAPGLALWGVALFLGLHACVAGLVGWSILRLPKEQRIPTAPWHLAFVGFIVGAVPLAELGWIGLAKAMLYGLIPVAAVIWGAGLAQVLRGAVALPIRPVLAIHLAPFALFSLVASLIGETDLALILAGLGAVLLAALILASGWLTRSGFGPLWAAFTFPLTAYAQALLALPDPWAIFGLAMTGLCVMIVPLIVWPILRQWPGGKLAAKTNAASA